MAPKQTDPQFKLRMTPEIKEGVERAAAANNRSMNAEILARLQQTLDVDSRWPNLPPAVVEKLRQREATNSYRSTIDQIAAAALKEIVSRPGIIDAEDLERITSTYEELRERETRGVREFMELVHSIARDIPHDDEDAPIAGQDIVPMATILSKKTGKS